MPRSNLSAVSINTVSQPRVQNTKFVRVPRPPRAVITVRKYWCFLLTGLQIGVEFGLGEKQIDFFFLIFFTRYTGWNGGASVKHLNQY